MEPVKFLVVGLLSLAALANPVARDGMVVLQSIKSAPSGFEYVGPASSSATVSLRLQLTQGNMTGLEQELYAVSTPGSARYGKYLTKEQVEAHVRPIGKTTSLVSDWISNAGISVNKASPAGDWYKFTLPVSKANDLLKADFGVYKDTATGKQSIRTLSYSVPESLKGHVSFIHPTVNFPSKKAASFSMVPKISKAKRDSLAKREDVPASCGGQITPDCLLDLYGIPKTPATQSSNQIGVMGIEEEFANDADLATFLATFRPDIPSTTSFTVQSIGGGDNDQDPSQAGLEANLDIQYTVGMATGVPVIYLFESNGFSSLGIADVLLAENDPPHVFTSSYGRNENELQGDDLTTECNAWMQLGARGVSVFFASGDGGVSGFQNEDCTDFLPTFPSSCPFVTSVGATLSVPEDPAFFSAGGFSDFFTIPSYQSTDVANYLSFLGDTNAGLFNPTGRGFPDVSAAGFLLPVFQDQNEVTALGTSISAPIFASTIGVLNDQLIAAGGHSMGFLNPFLYSTGVGGLNDIFNSLSGNPGCGTDGFPSAVGWDPINGLGSPNFPALKSLAFSAQGL